LIIFKSYLQGWLEGWGVMRLKDIMNELVETVSSNVPAETAWQKMWLKKIHHLLVMEGKELVGVVSDRDLGGQHGESMRKNRTVADFMSKHTFVASSSMTPKVAANLLRGNTIGCLPIVDHGELVGIITIADLLELIGRGSEKPVHQRNRRTLHRRGIQDRVKSLPGMK
jgi:CBS domain-containing protein